MKNYQKIIAQGLIFGLGVTGGLLLSEKAMAPSIFSHSAPGLQEIANQKNYSEYKYPRTPYFEGDLNKDGINDLVLFPGNNSPVQVMLIQPECALKVSNLEVMAGDRISLIHSGDFDGNGSKDILFGDGKYFSPLKVLKNDGKGNFSIKEYKDILTLPRQRWTDFDVDGDGDKDFLLGENKYGSKLRLLRNDGKGNFSQEYLPNSGYKTFLNDLVKAYRILGWADFQWLDL